LHLLAQKEPLLFVEGKLNGKNPINNRVK